MARPGLTYMMLFRWRKWLESGIPTVIIFGGDVVWTYPILPSLYERKAQIAAIKSIQKTLQPHSYQDVYFDPRNLEHVYIVDKLRKKGSK